MNNQNKPVPGAFQLKNFKIPKFEFNEPRIPEGNLELDFLSKGEFDEKNSVFTLILEFRAFEEDEASENSVVSVQVMMEATFVFTEQVTISGIPDYFYKNSIAIVFPYIRAMVSNLTLQSNIINPIILPTYNLTPLGEELKSNTIVV